MDDEKRGNNMPPYVQGRTANPYSTGGATRPMTPARGRGRARPRGSNEQGDRLSQGGRGYITPKKPGTNAQTGQGMAKSSTPGQVNNQSATPGASTKPAQQTLYDFFKQDLEDQRRSAMADTTSNAAARGVYYGSPLTTSQGDIQTQYLRGLGTLQANMLQNQEGNQLERLRIGAGLLGNTPQASGGGIDPNVFQTLGGLFGQSPAAAGQRSGPTITPQGGPSFKLPNYGNPSGRP